jgi:excinuclease ABC subunit A
MLRIPDGEKFHLLFPIRSVSFTSFSTLANWVTDSGFVRFQVGKATYSVADSFEQDEIEEDTSLYVVVDRLVKKTDDDFRTRLADSLRVVQEKGNGYISLFLLESSLFEHYSLHAACPYCMYSIDDLHISNFSFNSHHGACETCHGIGFSTTFLEADVINSRLSLAE